MTVELTAEQRELFDSQHFAVIGTTSPNGSPHLSVVWCRTDGDDILVSTVEGRQKHINISADNRVSILVKPDSNPYSYIEVRGTATMTREGGRKLIDQLASLYTGADRYPADDGTENVRVVVRISPEKIVTMGL